MKRTPRRVTQPSNTDDALVSLNLSSTGVGTAEVFIRMNDREILLGVVFIREAKKIYQGGPYSIVAVGAGIPAKWSVFVRNKTSGKLTVRTCKIHFMRLMIEVYQPPRKPQGIAMTARREA